MEYLNKINIIFVCLIICVVINGDQVTETNGTIGRDIDGPALIKLGRQLNNPLLTVIGMAIANQHQCSEWTQWSVCDTAIKDTFGIRKRTRKCHKINSSDSVADRRIKTESDLSICEGFCPASYNLTTNGFCLKLHVTLKTQDDAETQCQQEGGHLVNIDSDLKYEDVKRVLSGFSPNIYIDGRRKDASSPWQYKYGSQRGYFKWYSGYPKNSSNYLCLALSNTQFFDYLCTSKYAYVCEMPSA